jgi:hippurate hydrolase
MILDALRPIEDELVALRRHLHEHPELGFEEHRTSDLVAQLLADWGWKARGDLGTTGVIGSLSVGHGQRAIALRADFDALPIQENAAHTLS